MADIADYAPSGGATKKARAGSDAGSEEVEPEYCTRATLSFLPAPFGNLWILLLLCVAAAGIAYPIAQGWSKAVTYRAAPGVRTQLAATRRFPAFTAAFCPLSDATAGNLKVIADFFPKPSPRRPLPAPPAPVFPDLDSGVATYWMPSATIASCEEYVNNQAPALGPASYDGTQGSVAPAECDFSFPLLPGALDAATGRYDKLRITKVIKLTIFACGGPVVKVLDVNNNVVATTAGGVSWDNPAIFQACDPNSPTPPTTMASIQIDLSTPTVNMYGQLDTGDYAWLKGYTIQLSCLNGNSCLVNSQESTVRLEWNQLPTVGRSLSSFYTLNPSVSVTRPTRNVSLLGDSLHSPSCWLVTANETFSAAERALPLLDPTVNSTFSVNAYNDGLGLMYGFFDASDPDGLANLFASSSMAFVPTQTDQVALVRLGASVYRKLRPYSPTWARCSALMTSLTRARPPTPGPPAATTWRPLR